MSDEPVSSELVTERTEVPAAVISGVRTEPHEVASNILAVTNCTYFDRVYSPDANRLCAGRRV